MSERLGSLILAAAILTGWLAVCIDSLPARAAEAPLPLRWTQCDGGTSDVMCSSPRGVVANSDNGHVFVVDNFNNRVDEFTAFGQFVKAWGWDVVEGGGVGFEICVPSEGDQCKGGTTGSGVGQFNAPSGIALDSSGNIYVADWFNSRVQKFDPDGNFLLMFGDGVDQGPVHPGDVCTAQNLVEGDSCGAGTKGTAGGGQFDWPLKASLIAITSAGKVYVGDRNRIQRFDTAGVFQGELPLPGKDVKGLATDSAGNLYVIFNGVANVHKLSSSGEELSSSDDFNMPNPTAVAVASDGLVYAFGPVIVESFDQDPVFEFNAAGDLIGNWGKKEFNASTGLATNVCAGSEPPGNLYIANEAAAPNAFLRAYGTEPFGCSKARTAEATNLTEDSATLKGLVNPKGDPVTECHFEYGLVAGPPYEHSIPCVENEAAIGIGNIPVPVHADVAGLPKGAVHHFRLVSVVGGVVELGQDATFKTLGPPVITDSYAAEAAYTEATVVAVVNPEGFATKCMVEYGPDGLFGQETSEQIIGSDRADHRVTIVLQQLAPGTAYRWRMVCVNSSGTTVGDEHGVSTYRPFGAETGCPNQLQRSGPSTLLPDCRAYEMVSPVDKNGGDIVAGLPDSGDPGAYIQASTDGERLAYASRTAFGDEPNSFLYNEYLATRGADGSWSSEGIHPAVTGDPADEGFFGLKREFIAFTPDLCSAWLIDHQTPPPTIDGQFDYPNLYRRSNCGSAAGHLEALVPASNPLPPGTIKPYVHKSSVQGVSDDGRHAVFVARAKLTDGAADEEEDQVYDRFEGDLHHVGVLPSGLADTSSTAVGNGYQATLYNAVLGDGARIYWSSHIQLNTGTGRLYLRQHPAQAQSGQALGSAAGLGDLSAATGKATVTAGSASLKDVVTASGAFAIGQAISGAGIPPGTAITATGPGTLTLSAPATESSSGTPIVAGSNLVKNVATSSGEFVVGQTLMGEGIPFDTQIAEVGPGTLTLSAPAMLASVGTSLEAFSECTEVEKACTIPVSANLSTPSAPNDAFLWAVANDGSKALYSEKEDLYEFDLSAAEEGAAPRLIASHVKGVAGAGEDLARIYFVSSDALTGSEQNSEGAIAQSEEPNLYVEDEGTLRFIATLIAGDVGFKADPELATAYDVVSPNSYFRATRVTPDGARLAFESRAPLTGFDNRDAGNGRADVEVFTYEVGGALVCVSCNPSGGRPASRELEQPYKLSVELGARTEVQAAAWIPTWEHPLHPSNVLSEDGNRIFFNSSDALLPRDTNGAPDVYEWERPGSGSCAEGGASYLPANSGCLFLISTGESPFESLFWEASRDGRDVFFTTASKLLNRDPGLVDLYDARVGGGFLEPLVRKACEGEACQSPPPPPDFGTPASSSFSGPGDPVPGRARKRCPSGTHRLRRAGKVRCVKKRRGKGTRSRQGKSHRERRVDR